MEIVDSHHHLWSVPSSGPSNHKWLRPVSEGGLEWHFAGDVEQLKKSYLTDDFIRDATHSSFKVIKSVHVQAEADDPIEEVNFLEKISQENPNGFPHGIVAHANLTSAELPTLLEMYTRDHPAVKGIRQMLNWSTEDPRLTMTDRDDYLTDRTWLEGFQLLVSHSLSFDLQLYPSQMLDAAKVARQYPDAVIILNHCGLPLGGSSGFDRWKEGMKHLAEQSNVVCKLSGLAMLYHDCSKEVFSPYIVECLRLFTPKRCMFGSNYPVDKLNIKYDELVNVYLDIVENDAGLSKDELDLVFKENAIKTYRL